MGIEAAPLTWAFSDDSNLQADRLSNGVLFSIDGGFSGILMARVTSYSAAEYTLRQTIETSASDLSIRWELECLGGNGFAESWNQAIPAVTKKQVFETKIEIAPNCGVQRWRLSGFSQFGGERIALSVTELGLFKR